MQFHYLGLVKFTLALEAQNAAVAAVADGALGGVILGFESEPVLTLGWRSPNASGVPQKLPEPLQLAGYEAIAVDRGGQATLHMPGQLVVFPICDVTAWGARAWVEALGEVSRRSLQRFGVQAHWDACRPGLYTSRGKIMACGIRLRRGISTHGVSINVCNSVQDFAWIDPCGVKGGAIDRMGPPAEVSEVFAVWCEEFNSLVAESKGIEFASTDVDKCPNFEHFTRSCPMRS